MIAFLLVLFVLFCLAVAALVAVWVVSCDRRDPGEHRGSIKAILLLFMGGRR